MRTRARHDVDGPHEDVAVTACGAVAGIALVAAAVAAVTLVAAVIALALLAAQ